MSNTEPQTLVPIKDLIPSLLTWEDHAVALAKLQEVDGMVNWYRADILMSALEKFGDMSISELAMIVNRPISTVNGLIRTARAFPPEKRVYSMPFYLHQQASYADSFDEKTKEFSGEDRFELIKKAEDEMFSYRDIAKELKEMRRRKQKEENNEKKPICAYCGRINGRLVEYLIKERNTSATETAFSFLMHTECYPDYLLILKEKKRLYELVQD